MGLFSDLGYLSQLVLLIPVTLRALCLAVSPHHVTASVAASVTLLASALMFVVYNVAMIAQKYTEGLVRIPNLPVHWFVSRPRDAWETSKDLLVWLDMFGDGAWLVRNLGLFVVVGHWHCFSLQARGNQKPWSVVTIVGLVLTCVCGVAIPLVHLYLQASTIQSIAIPHLVMHVSNLILWSFLIRTSHNLRKVAKNLQRSGRLSLLNRVGIHSSSITGLLLAVALETLGLLIIDISALTNRTGGLFNNKLVTDLLTVIHTSGLVCSYLYAFSLIHFPRSA